VVRRALQLMQSEFSPNMWKACWEHVDYLALHDYATNYIDDTASWREPCRPHSSSSCAASSAMRSTSGVD